MEQKAKKILVGFVILMILLTILSRVADSVTIAKVTTSRPAQGSLNFSVDGMGTVAAESKKYVYVLADVKVVKVFADEGQAIKEKDPLLQLSVEDIRSQYEEMEKKMKEADIQLLQTKLDGVSAAMDPGNPAYRALQQAKEDEKDAREKLTEAQEEYKDAMGKKGEKTLEEKQEAYDKAVQQYGNEKRSYDDAVLNAKESVEAEEEALYKINEKDAKIMGMLDYYAKAYGDSDYEGKEDIVKEFMILKYGEQGYDEFLIKKEETDPSILENDSGYKDMVRQRGILENALINYYSGGYSTTEDIRNKAIKDVRDFAYGKGKYEEYLKEKKGQEKKLKKAERERDLEISKQDALLMEKQEIMDKAEEDLAGVEDGSYDFEAELKAEEAAVNGAEGALKSAERSVEAAQAEYDASQMQKKNTQMTDVEKRVILNRKLEILEEDLKALKQEAGELKELIDKKGIIKSEAAGTVEKILAEEGKKTSAEEAMVISNGEFGFTGEANEKESQHISIGETIKVWINEDEAIETTIESVKYSISESGDRTASFTAVLPKGVYMEGMSIRFKISKSSKTYRDTIPLQAVRTDSKNQKFVLVVEEKDTVLGKQKIARRADVTIEEQDSQTAAIQGIYDMDIIVSSNKDISDGDRIRIR